MLAIINFFFCFLVVGFVTGNSEADFGKLVKSKFFVDKTLMIKDFMTDDDLMKFIMVITAPPKSGKSTIIDMFKRFFSLPTDSNGTLVPLESTENYKLFCQPKLKICEDQEFVKKHMGQYAVLKVDYSHLKKVRNFETFLQQIRYVIRDSFLPHTYLAEYPDIFTVAEDQEYFNRHHQSADGNEISESDIKSSFAYLSRLLNDLYNKHVIVLLDDYHSCFTEFVPMEDAKEICKLLEEINEPLFKFNSDLERALLTGVVNLRCGIGSWKDDVAAEYRWLEDHRFAKYYGLDKTEVLKFINTFTREEANINKMQDILDFYYGYQIRGQHRILNIWSTVHFFQANMKLKRYWVKRNNTNWLIDVISVYKDNFAEVRDLVTKRLPVFNDISQPFYIKEMEVFQRKNATAYVDLDRFIYLMYSWGYLAPAINKEMNKPLRVANNEVYVELSTILENIYVRDYKVKIRYVKILNETVNSLTPNKANEKLYDLFVQGVHNILKNVKPYNMSEEDYKSFLYVILSSKYPVGEKQTGKFQTTVEFNNSFNALPESLKPTAALALVKYSNQTELKTTADLTVINKQEMVFIIETKFYRGNTSLTELAKESLCEAFLSYKSYLDKHPLQFVGSNMTVFPKGVVYVGLAFDMVSMNVSSACYYPSVDRHPTFVDANDDEYEEDDADDADDADA